MRGVEGEKLPVTVTIYPSYLLATWISQLDSNQPSLIDTRPLLPPTPPLKDTEDNKKNTNQQQWTTANQDTIQ